MATSAHFGKQEIRQMGIDQETAIELLRERYARGGLPLEEFRRMMSHLMVTQDPIECQAILDELPPEPAHEERVALRRVDPSRSSSRKAHRITAFFGEVDRGGVLWELGPETNVSATFGEAKIDVRMAKLVEGENILRLSALFGEISVIVPQGLQVLVEGSARFGEVSVPGHSIAGIAASEEFSLGGERGGSYLRIEAVANFGEVKILTV
jgi:cell wall-active antibiotic response 4TMS protein YvqF